MNNKKFFELAAKKGISASELSLLEEHSLSIGLFHSAIDNYSLSDSKKIIARGIYNDKFGMVTSEVDNKETPDFLVDEIIDIAKVIEKDDKAIIFKGSKKYSKRNAYNKALEGVSIDKKLVTLYAIEKKIKEFDKRVSEIEEVSYSESSNTEQLLNSYGLKLKQKSNLFTYSASVVVKDGDETKTGYYVFFDNDPKKFDIDLFVKKVVEDGTTKLHGIKCPSKKYKTVLGPKAAASLVGFYLSSASSEEIQKQSSFLVGKLNAKVASSKLTVSENPLARNLFCRYFDDEGVATYKKTIIEKGVLKTYLYNLETAAREKRETTGNGYRESGKIGIDTVNLCVRSGKKSEEEMIASLKEGVYITRLMGLHAGINSQSGNFSLQAEGFIIVDGKIDKPLSMMTVAGNLLEMFEGVQGVANNSELMPSSITSPSILVKSLVITSE
ncbi:MAG: TldD/PmbA family protein [Bacilli bacterium]|jgi:PmbA protein